MSRLVSLVFLVLASIHSLVAADPTERGVTVILVRHAETAGSTRGGGDPSLSDAGRTRAEALANTLADSGVTHLFASQALRCHQTLEPLAAARGLETTTIPAGENERQVAALRALTPGSVAVVAGHSNTVPQLVAALGGQMNGLVEDPQYGKLIPHEDYGRMVVVVLGGDGKATTTIELRYGAPLPKQQGDHGGR